MHAKRTYKGIELYIDTYNEEIAFIQPDRLAPQLPFTHWRYPPSLSPDEMSYNAQWKEKHSIPHETHEDFNYWCKARDQWIEMQLLKHACIMIDVHIPHACCLYCGGPLVCVESAYYDVQKEGYFDTEDRQVEDHTIVCAYNHRHKCGNWELEIDEDGIGHIRLTK